MMKLEDFSTDRNEIFSLYNKKEIDIKNDLILLREWMKKLPYLPSEALSDEFLMIYLLKNKFSVEKAKRKIEAYCSMKAQVRFNYLYEKISAPAQDASVFIALPQLTKDFQRIIFSRITNENDFDIKECLTSLLFLKEFLSRYDFNNGEIIVLDWLKCSSFLMTKFRINVITDTLALLLEGHSSRISQIHVINKAAKFILSGVIPFLSSKLSSRMHFHDDYNSFKMHFPLKYLPSDFGGELESIGYFLDQWNQVYLRNHDNLMEFVNTKSCEELRPNGPKQEEMQGTFKNLNVD